MDKRKAIIHAYKDRRLTGGVYRIVNTLNGKYLLSHSMNLKSVQNHFQFAMMTGSTIHPKLQKDHEQFGAQAFRLEILEELIQKPDQSQAEFLEDLKTLEQLWREDFDASKAY